MTRSIDGFAFSRQCGEVRGSLSTAQSTRVVASGAQEVRVDYAVRGIVTALGKPGLQVSARGDVVLVCQRCLEPLAQPIDVDVELELSDDQAAIDAADDDVDRVLATHAMPVEQLVEDEVLLCLPMAPRHARCQAGAVAEHAPSAFASALAARSLRQDKSNG